MVSEGPNHISSERKPWPSRTAPTTHTCGVVSVVQSRTSGKKMFINPLWALRKHYLIHGVCDCGDRTCLTGCKKMPRFKKASNTAVMCKVQAMSKPKTRKSDGRASVETSCVITYNHRYPCPSNYWMSMSSWYDLVFLMSWSILFCFASFNSLQRGNTPWKSVLLNFHTSVLLNVTFASTVSCQQTILGGCL